MPSIIHTSPFHTPAGALLLGACAGKLCLCDWLDLPDRAAVDSRLCARLGGVMVPDTSAVIDAARAQLSEYFAGTRRVFDIPLLFWGTPFQQQVWHRLSIIPYGSVTTYADVAAGIGRPSAVRAVANAIGANPISIFVPCHRVIGSNGTLTGYAGGLPAKACLLNIEKLG